MSVTRKLQDVLTLEKELAKEQVEEQRVVIMYVKAFWLKEFFEIDLRARTTYLPQIISTYSNMPRAYTDYKKSTTEKAALRNIETISRLENFNSALSKLPSELRSILIAKYMIRGSDGRMREDERVYKEIGLSRTPYYEKKRDAEYHLGMLIIENISNEMNKYQEN